MIARYRRIRGWRFDCPACSGWGMVKGGPLGVRDCDFCDGEKGVIVTRWIAVKYAVGILSRRERRWLAADRREGGQPE